MNKDNKIEWTKLNNTVSGTPRYVCSWVNFGTKTYAEAVIIANQFGGKKYDTKQYGGGIVFNEYNTNFLNAKINDSIANPHKYHRYTGVLTFVHSTYVNKDGEYCHPTFEQRMIDAGKSENDQQYKLVQSTEILGRVYAHTQVGMVDAANDYAKDNELHISYNIICVKNATV